MTTQELINSIIESETEEGSTIVIQDTTLRGYLNKVAKKAVEDEQQKNKKELFGKIGV